MWGILPNTAPEGGERGGGRGERGETEEGRYSTVRDVGIWQVKGGAISVTERGGGVGVDVPVMTDLVPSARTTPTDKRFQ